MPAEQVRHSLRPWLRSCYASPLIAFWPSSSPHLMRERVEAETFTEEDLEETDISLPHVEKRIRMRNA